MTARRHSVNEQHRISRSSREQIHPPPPNFVKSSAALTARFCWRRQKLANSVHNPRRRPKKQQRQPKQRRRKHSSRLRPRVNQIHSPRWTDINRPRMPQSDVIPYRRLVHQLLDSAVKKFRHINNARAVTKPRKPRQPHTLTIFQNQCGALSRRPKRRRPSVRSNRIDHRRCLTDDHPVRPRRPEMCPRAKRPHIHFIDRLLRQQRRKSRKLLQLTPKYPIDRFTALSPRLHPRTGDHVPDAHNIWLHRNFPNPIEVLARQRLHVQSRAFDRLVRREVRPDRHLRRPALHRPQFEMPRKKGSAQSRRIHKPLRPESLTALRLNRGNSLALALDPRHLLVHHVHAALHHRVHQLVVEPDAIHMNCPHFHIERLPRQPRHRHIVFRLAARHLP